MSGYANLNVKVDEFIEAKHVVATPENFKDFGFLYTLDNPPVPEIRDIVLENGVKVKCDTTLVTGSFICEWRKDLTLYCKNNAVESEEYTIATCVDDFRVTRELNYHPDSGQSFTPLDQGEFILLLCNRKKPGEIIAFHFDGTKGAYIHPGIWHQPPIPMMLAKQAFVTSQSRAHMCVVYDSYDDCKKFIKF